MLPFVGFIEWVEIDRILSAVEAVTTMQINREFDAIFHFIRYLDIQ